MRRHLTIVLPPLVLALILSLLFILPRHPDLQESAISPDLPLRYELDGWFGEKIDPSDKELEMLAGDTKFSKAVYTRLRDDPDEKKMPPVIVSLVYSGSDMNASIHRPERCLPSQGHLDIKTTTTDVTLADGRTIRFNRLTSRVPVKDKPGVFQQHINYYVFIGSHTIRTTHWDRTLQDMLDRALLGIAQRWAYYQIGSYWGGDSEATEEETDAMLRQIIGQLTPQLMDWSKIDE